MTRIVIIAALVLGGIVILASGFGAGGAVAVAPGVTTTPSSSPSPANTHSTSPGPQLTPKIKGVKFVVFNAGFDVPNVVPGLAAQVQRTLVGDKYVVAGGQNAQNAQVTIKKTIVYYTDHGNSAQNQVGAEYVAPHHLHNAQG